MQKNLTLKVFFIYYTYFLHSFALFPLPSLSLMGIFIYIVQFEHLPSWSSSWKLNRWGCWSETSDRKLLLWNVVPQPYTPVLPRAPAALDVSSRLSTCVNIACSQRSIISCAIFWPFTISTGSLPVLSRMTMYSPLYSASMTPASTSIPCLTASPDLGAIRE